MKKKTEFNQYVSTKVVTAVRPRNDSTSAVYMLGHNKKQVQYQRFAFYT
ncbi:hypothetical protein [Mucilaginibacter limnophilus]|nr:hypothetical protein [Mucilaginibacter limnophilus]